MPPTQVGHEPDIRNRGLMVLPTGETQAGVSRQRRLLHDLAQQIRQALSLADTCIALIPPPSTSNPDGLLQIRQSLGQSLGHLRQCFGHITDENNALGRDAGPMISQPQPLDVGPQRANFKCFECSEILQSRGSLRRHVKDKHYPELEYRCGCCSYTHRRPDKFKHHFMVRHNRRLSGDEAEQYAHHFPCPPICYICSVTVDSWTEFHDCFISHCPRQDPPRQTSGDTENLERNIDAGPDNGTVLGSPGIEDSQASQHHNGAGYGGRVGTYAPGASDNVINHTAGLMASPMHPFLSDRAGRIADPFYPGVEAPHDPSNSRQLARSDPLRAQVLRRLAMQPRRTSIQRLSSPRRESQARCRGCHHRFRDCPICYHVSVSRRSCHACPRSEAVLVNPRVQPGSFGAGVPRGQGLDYPTTIDPSFLTLEYQPELGIGAAQTMQGQHPSGNGYYQGPQQQGWSLNRMAAAFTGTRGAPGRNPPRAMAVTSLDEPVLSEYDLMFPPALISKIASAPDTLISILPLMDPFKKWGFRPLKGVGVPALSGTYYGFHDPICLLLPGSCTERVDKSLHFENPFPVSVTNLYRPRPDHEDRSSSTHDHKS